MTSLAVLSAPPAPPAAEPALHYYLKEIEKLVLCFYGEIMHLGNVRRILEKRVKHSATNRVLHASLVFS